MSQPQSFPPPSGQQPSGMPQHQTPYAPPLQQGAVRSEYMQKAPWRRPSATWGQAIKLWWKNMFVFHGRASRSEYWWMTLTYALASFVLSMVGVMVDMAILGSQAASTGSTPDDMTMTPGSTVVNILSMILSLSVIPLSVRRMHDINRSGWWILVFNGLSFIPILVALIPLAAVAVQVDAAHKAGTAAPDLGAPLIGLFIALAISLAVSIWSIVWHATDSKMAGTRFDLDAPKLPEPQHTNWSPANPAFVEAQQAPQGPAQPQPYGYGPQA